MKNFFILIIVAFVLYKCSGNSGNSDKSQFIEVCQHQDRKSVCECTYDKLEKNYLSKNLELTAQAMQSSLLECR
jgi:hypothetical protein